MSPESAIAMLDRQLAQHGEDVLLERVTGTQGQITFSAPCRARLLVPREPQPVTEGAQQREQTYALSPSDINRAQWPGPAILPVPPGDRRIPKKGPDRLVVQDKTLAIENGVGIYVDGELVRVEVTVRG